MQRKKGLVWVTFWDLGLLFGSGFSLLGSILGLAIFPHLHLPITNICMIKCPPPPPPPPLEVRLGVADF